MIFAQNGRLNLLQAAAPLAGTPLVSPAIHLSGFSHVAVFGTLAVAAGNSVKVTLSRDGGTTWDDLVDADGKAVSVTPSVDGQVVLLDLVKPRGGPLLRLEIDRSGTNTAVGDWYAVPYGSREVPTTFPPTVDVHIFDEPARVEA